MGIQFGLDTAMKAAENLARLQPEETFFVMQAVYAVKVELPVVVSETI